MGTHANRILYCLNSYDHLSNSCPNHLVQSTKNVLFALIGGSKKEQLSNQVQPRNATEQVFSPSFLSESARNEFQPQVSPYSTKSFINPLTNNLLNNLQIDSTNPAFKPYSLDTLQYSQSGFFSPNDQQKVYSQADRKFDEIITSFSEKTETILSSRRHQDIKQQETPITIYETIMGTQLEVFEQYQTKFHSESEDLSQTERRFRRQHSRFQTQLEQKILV